MECRAGLWYVLDVRSLLGFGGAVKGDRVEIVVDTGDDTQTYEVVATRAGRRVEVSTGRGIVEVSEVTRTGTAVRTARFMASRVVALVEHPVDTSSAVLAAPMPAPLTVVH
jgi:hypothetical protein